MAPKNETVIPKIDLLNCGRNFDQRASILSGNSNLPAKRGSVVFQAQQDERIVQWPKEQGQNTATSKPAAERGSHGKGGYQTSSIQSNKNSQSQNNEALADQKTDIAEKQSYIEKVLMSPMDEDDLKQQIESQLQMEDEMLRQYVAKQQRDEQTSDERQDSFEKVMEGPSSNIHRGSLDQIMQNIKEQYQEIFKSRLQTLKIREFECVSPQILSPDFEGTQNNKRNQKSKLSRSQNRNNENKDIPQRTKGSKPFLIQHYVQQPTPMSNYRYFVPNNKLKKLPTNFKQKQKVQFENLSTEMPLPSLRYEAQTNKEGMLRERSENAAMPMDSIMQQILQKTVESSIEKGDGNVEKFEPEIQKVAGTDQYNVTFKKLTEPSSESNRIENLVSKLGHQQQQQPEEEKSDFDRKILRPFRNTRGSVQNELSGDDCMSDQNVGSGDENSYFDCLGYNYSHVRNNSTLNTSAVKGGERSSIAQNEKPKEVELRFIDNRQALSDSDGVGQQRAGQILYPAMISQQDQNGKDQDQQNQMHPFFSGRCFTNKSNCSNQKGSLKMHINQGYRAPAQIEKFLRIQKLRKSEAVQLRNLRNDLKQKTKMEFSMQEKELVNSMHFDFDNPLFNFEIDKGTLDRNIQQSRDFGLLGDFFDRREYIKLYKSTQGIEDKIAVRVSPQQDANTTSMMYRVGGPHDTHGRSKSQITQQQFKNHGHKEKGFEVGQSRYLDRPLSTMIANSGDANQQRQIFNRMAITPINCKRLFGKKPGRLMKSELNSDFQEQMQDLAQLEASQNLETIRQKEFTFPGVRNQQIRTQTQNLPARNCKKMQQLMAQVCKYQVMADQSKSISGRWSQLNPWPKQSLDQQTNVLTNPMPSKESYTIEGLSDEEQFPNKLDPMNKKEITVTMDKSPAKRKSNMINNTCKNSPQLKEFEKFMKKGKAKFEKFAAKRGSSNYDLENENEQQDNQQMPIETQEDPGSLISQNQLNYNNLYYKSITQDISKNSITQAKSIHSKSTHGQIVLIDKEQQGELMVNDAVITELGSPQQLEPEEKHARSSRLNKDITELFGNRKQIGQAGNNPTLNSIFKQKINLPSRQYLNRKMRYGDHETSFTFRNGVLKKRNPSLFQPSSHPDSSSKIEESDANLEDQKSGKGAEKEQRKTMMNMQPISKGSANNLGSINIVGEVVIVKANDNGDEKSGNTKNLDLRGIAGNKTEQIQPSRWAGNDDEKMESPFRNQLLLRGLNNDDSPKTHPNVDTEKELKESSKIIEGTTTYAPMDLDFKEVVETSNDDGFDPNKQVNGQLLVQQARSLYSNLQKHTNVSVTINKGKFKGRSSENQNTNMINKTSEKALQDVLNRSNSSLIRQKEQIVVQNEIRIKDNNDKYRYRRDVINKQNNAKGKQSNNASNELSGGGGQQVESALSGPPSPRMVRTGHHLINEILGFKDQGTQSKPQGGGHSNRSPNKIERFDAIIQTIHNSQENNDVKAEAASLKSVDSNEMTLDQQLRASVNNQFNCQNLAQKPSQIQRSIINYQKQILAGEKLNLQNIPLDNLRVNIRNVSSTKNSQLQSMINFDQVISNELRQLIQLQQSQHVPVNSTSRAAVLVSDGAHQQSKSRSVAHQSYPSTRYTQTQNASYRQNHGPAPPTSAPNQSRQEVKQGRSNSMMKKIQDIIVDIKTSDDINLMIKKINNNGGGKQNRMLSPPPTLIKHSKEQRAKYHSYSTHQKLINKSKDQGGRNGKQNGGVMQHAQWKQKLISDILIDQQKESNMFSKIAGQFEQHGIFLNQGNGN